MNNVWVLAVADNGASPTIGDEPATEEQMTGTKADSDPNRVPQTQQRKGLFDSPMFMILSILLMVYVFFLVLRSPQKKQRQRHKQMVQSLKKNDKVQTIGGIIGTIVDVKDDTITLKIDESNNTKIKVTFAAIGKNLSQDK